MQTRKEFRWLLGLIGAMASVWLIGAAMLIADGTREDVASADVIVVLGNTVEPNGMPSARLKARLDRAVHLHREGRASHIMVSGAVGREGFDEARVMRDHVVASGVLTAHVIVDSAGFNTRATATNAVALMQRRGWNRALVVSQFHHVPRCRLAFRQAGAGDVGASYARFVELRDVGALTREMAAWLRYRFAP